MIRTLLIATVLACLVAPEAALGQAADTVELGVLIDEITTEFAPLAQELFEEIRAVVGADAVVVMPEGNVLENGYDRVRAEATYDSLVAGPPDIILAFGPVIAEVVSAQQIHAKPTILFGAFKREWVDLPEDRTTSGVDNFTYVVTSQSYARDLETFKELYDFSNVGIVVPAAQPGVPRLRQVFDQLAAQLGVTYELIAFESMSGFREALGRIDALYLAEGWGIPDSSIEAMATTLLEARMPSFSAVRRQDVDRGFMATNQPDENLERFFRRIALHVEAVIAGENLSDRPVLVELNETMTLNFNTAELVGVPLRYSLIATTEFVGDFVNVLSEETYSLAEVIEEALRENLLLGADRFSVDLSAQDLRAAWANYLPSVRAVGQGSIVDPDLAEVSAGRNPQYSAMGSVVLDQAIFSPGANAAISINRSLLAAQREAVRASEYDLIVEAADAYFTALVLKANLQITKQNLDQTQQNLRTARENFEAGQTGRGDVLRFESQAARDMQSLVEALNQLDQAFYALNQLLNDPVNREIDVEDVALAEGAMANLEVLQTILDDPAQRVQFEDFLVSEALSRAPELASLDFNLAATERSIALFGSQRFLPTVGASAQYNRTFDQGGAGLPDPSFPPLDAYYTVGLSLSVPLFDSNLRTIDRQAARIQRDQIQLNRDYTALSIEKNVRDVVLELTNQVANIQLSAVSEEAASEGLALTEAAYANGAVSIVELLDAQSSLLQAQLARSRATYGFMSTGVVLGRLIGHFFVLSSDAENQAFLARFQAFRAQSGG